MYLRPMFDNYVRCVFDEFIDILLRVIVVMVLYRCVLVLFPQPSYVAFHK